MSLITEILNVAEDKIGQLEHEGQILFRADRLCSLLEIEDEKVQTFSLKDGELVEIKGDSGAVDYVTESGAYKLIIKRSNDRAKKACDYLCEEVLPNL